MAEAKSFAEDLESGNVEQPVEAPEAEAEAPAEDRQPRDEHGKFAKKGDSEGAPPAPAEKQEFDGAATIAERRKRQEAEAELAALRAQLQQQQNPPPAPPDIWEDPEGRLAAERLQLQQVIYNERFATSMRFAEIQHGKEAVREAVAWAAERELKDPQFGQQALNERDPVGFAMEQYRREQMASISPEDFAAFTQWREQQANPPPQPAVQQVQPPPTLTGERNLGKRDGPVSTGPSTFGEILGGR